jgi:hypothetical protein
MKFRNLFAPTIAAAVVLSSSMMMASAQEERPRGGRPEGGRFGGPGGPGGGPGGPGGPGGMMMGMGQRDGAGSLVMLLGREEVRTEIKLMPDQVEGLRKMAERMRPERPDFDFRSATDQERSAFMAKMQAQQAERAADAKAQLEELLMPKQFERLEQIALQAQGAMALVNTEVAEKLGLTKEVTEAMGKDLTANQEKVRDMVQAMMRDRDREAAGAMREKMEEMRKDLDTKLVAHLSDEQKTMFEEMKGEPFELAPMTFGGRGAGPGGERGAGPGGERGGPEGRGREGDRPQRGRERGGDRPQRGGDRPERD